MKKILLYVLLPLSLIPLFYIIILSVSTYYRYPDLLPGGLTLRHYSQLFFENSLFYRGLVSSLFIGSMTALLSTVIGYFTARVFVRYLKLKYMTTLVIISIPIFIPAMPLFLGIHQMVLKSPFSNSIIGIVMAHVLVSLPYTSNIFMNHLRGIPADIEQVAKTLGATRRIVLTRVLIPMLKPAIGLSFAISFLISNTEYFSTFLIGGGNVITLSMIMYPYISNNDYGLSSSIGIIFILGHLTMFAIVHQLTKSNEDIKLLYIDH